MKNLVIGTYKPGTAPDVPHFFILNKGSNSGQPSRKPWCNCYIVTGDNVEYVYWLCFTLWKTGRFRQFLKGSVIEFITLSDLKTFLRTFEPVMEQKANLSKLTDALDKIQQKQNELLKRYSALEDLKIVVLHRYTKGG